jgi:lysyl-tRNA synthetase class 2
VARVEGPWIRLADALSALDVFCETPAPVEPGNLCVLEGVPAKHVLRQARLVERWARPVPASDGEHARLAWHAVGPRLAARARAFRVIREYFRAEGFVEIDTPARVRLPGLDLHVDAVRAEGGYLCTSPELHLKRLLTGGLPRIYQLSHCHRSGELGPWHEPEFMMLEWYRAFAGQEEVMADTEVVVEQVVHELAGAARVCLPDGTRVEIRRPFARLTVREAFRRHAGIADAVDLAATDEARYFELLVERVEPALARRKRPVFIWQYPATQASLARRSPDDPSVAERFELYVAGVELCNGFGELTDPVEQLSRFRADQRKRKKLRRPVYAIDERFLAALREGMPPAGGNALGVDRLIALALGVPRIADVLPFPAEREWS